MKSHEERSASALPRLWTRIGTDSHCAECTESEHGGIVTSRRDPCHDESSLDLLRKRRLQEVVNRPKAAGKAAAVMQNIIAN